MNDAVGLLIDEPAGLPANRGQVALSRARARLSASRDQLQARWLPPPTHAARSARSPDTGPSRLGDWIRSWSQRLRDVPVIGVAVDAAHRWWDHNPWRLAGESVADEVDYAIGPWVSRHPWLSVSIAAAAGYGIVALRPWTWPGVPEFVGPLPQRAGRWFLRQVTDAPLQAILASLLVAAQTTHATSGATPPDAPENP